jgi:hypothetical protein
MFMRTRACGPAVPPPGGTPPEEARPEAKVDYVKWTK